MPIAPRIPILATMSLLSALLVPSAAFAGGADRATPDQSTTGSAVSDEPSMPQAPIGHRQPRAADIPADARNAQDAWLNRINRSIDGKLTICRGC